MVQQYRVILAVEKADRPDKAMHTAGFICHAYKHINPILTYSHKLYRVCTILCVSLRHIHLLLLSLAIFKEICGNLREQCI